MYKLIFKKVQNKINLGVSYKIENTLYHQLYEKLKQIIEGQFKEILF